MKKAISTSLMRACSWLLTLVFALGLSVSDVQGQCSLVCNDNVQISLDEDCSVELDADMILEGTYPATGTCGYSNLQVQVKRNGVWQPVSPTGGNAVITSADLRLGTPNCTKQLEVRVRQIVGSQSCWGYLTVEDKLPPVVTVKDIWLSCAVNRFDPNVLAASCAAGGYNIPDAIPTATDNCSGVTRTFVDNPIVDLDCNAAAINGRKVSAYFVRKWTFTDGCGNVTVAEQFVYLERRNVWDVQMPGDIELACDGPAAAPYITPANVPYVTTAEGCRVPLYPEDNSCEFNITYTDQLLPVCDGTVKILRTWVVYDWCVATGSGTTPVPYTNPRYHVQVIKLVDHTGPVAQCPANMTVSTDPLKCCATVDMPDVIVADNCSRIASVSAMITVRDPFTGSVASMQTVTGRIGDFPGNNWWVPDTMAYVNKSTCLPLGTHEVRYTITDDCGNQTFCNFTLTVADYTPPIMACDEFTVGVLDGDDPDDCYLPEGNCKMAGVGYIKAKTFDDGSYDNCNGTLKFRVRRMPDADGKYSAFVESLNKADGIPPCNDGVGRPTEYERATSTGSAGDIYGGGSDSLKIYCGEVGTTQTVILRAYQLNPDGTISIAEDGEPVYGECMIQIEVQDKVRPSCVPPAHVTVSCDNFDPTLWAYGKATVSDNCCLDETKVYQNQCGLEHSVNLNQFDTSCNKGTIIRTFRAFDCRGNSSSCTQRVVVTYREDYYVRFPDDRIVTVCDGSGVYGAPTFFGEDCELLATSFKDDTFTVVPDACYKIERKWKVINWCTYDPNCDLTHVPNPSPNATVNNPANFPGPIVSNVDGCNPATINNPWRSACVRINPTDAANTSYTRFWQLPSSCWPSGSKFNGYHYTQIIKIVDGVDPVAQCVKPDTCDITDNDPNFWNVDYWWDATHSSHDLCEMPIDLKLTATDACSGANLNFRYLLFLDLDGNGTMETVVSSSNLPGVNTILYNNANNPNYTGGTPRAFDHRVVVNPSLDWYRFAIQVTRSGANATAAVRFNTVRQPNNYVLPQIPHGKHKIKWIIEDGCGNESVCEYPFEIKDCKAPTVVCKPLSVNIMPTGMITLWASDFLEYTFDNCTPADQIKIAVSTGDPAPTVFPRDPVTRLPITNVTFTCANLGPNVVQLWAEDSRGNADYCQVVLLVQDNAGNCGQKASVAGALKTEGASGVEGGNVELVSPSHPAYPPVYQMSNQQGSYAFSNAMPVQQSAKITPVRTDNPLNGVTTLDLALISKHILGLETLSTPYKMIAADANKSGTITTFDVVELRKLILGIYEELPNNNSWRFVDKAYNFPNPSNPFSAAFPEYKTIASVIQGGSMSEDFVGIKVGDVNGTAQANDLMAGDDRSAGTFFIDAKDAAVKAGDFVSVNFKAEAGANAYQFTMNLNGLDVVEIIPGANMGLDNFAVFQNAITAAVENGAAEFTVKFRATKSGDVSKMVSANSRITKAVAYTNGGEQYDVAFRFNGTNGSTVAGAGFELLQNTPNPVKNTTVITFNLPEAAEATLTISNAEGRVVKTISGNYVKGINKVEVNAAELTPGMLFYELKTATDRATKKMIVVDVR